MCVIFWRFTMVLLSLKKNHFSTYTVSHLNWDFTIVILNANPKKSVLDPEKNLKKIRLIKNQTNHVFPHI